MSFDPEYPLKVELMVLSSLLVISWRRNQGSSCICLPLINASFFFLFLCKENIALKKCNNYDDTSTTGRSLKETWQELGNILANLSNDLLRDFHMILKHFLPRSWHRILAGSVQDLTYDSGKFLTISSRYCGRLMQYSCNIVEDSCNILAILWKTHAIYCGRLMQYSCKLSRGFFQVEVIYLNIMVHTLLR